MKGNVGGFDRWIRIFLGLAIVSFAFIGPKSPWAWLGLIPFFTGVLRLCPIYALFGIDTFKGVNTKEEVE